MKTKPEIINRIEVLETGELLLGLEGEGRRDYQFVYRAAMGVYWDEERQGFKSTPMRTMSCSQWFRHIAAGVYGELGVKLTFGEHVTWSNVPEEEQAKIRRENPLQEPIVD